MSRRNESLAFESARRWVDRVVPTSALARPLAVIASALVPARPLVLIAVATVLTIPMLLTAAPALAERVDQQKLRQVQVAYMYRFLFFAQWPADGGPGRPFVIGILGEDPFGELLDGLSEQTVNDRAVVVVHYPDLESIDAPHLLFVSGSALGDIPRIMAALADDSVITIGESEDFAERGGTIEFRIVDDRLRFDINTQSASASGVTFSSQLLKVAHEVLR